MITVKNVLQWSYFASIGSPVFRHLSIIQVPLVSFPKTVKPLLSRLQRYGYLYYRGSKMKPKLIKSVGRCRAIHASK